MRAFKSWLDACDKTVIRHLPFPISLLKLGVSKRGCGHADPNSFAGLFPGQGLKDSGRANLNSLTGGLAYGIPRYSYTDLQFGSVSSLPTIVPDEVFTSGSLPLIWNWTVFLWYKTYLEKWTDRGVDYPDRQIIGPRRLKEVKKAEKR